MSCAGLDPSAAATQISLRSPDRAEANAIRPPSGEKQGWPSKKDEARWLSQRPPPHEPVDVDLTQRLAEGEPIPRACEVQGPRSVTRQFGPLGGSTAPQGHAPEMEEVGRFVGAVDERGSVACPGDVPDVDAVVGETARGGVGYETGAELEDIDLAPSVHSARAQNIGKAAPVGGEGGAGVVDGRRLAGDEPGLSAGDGKEVDAAGLGSALAGVAGTRRRQPLAVGRP